MEAKDSIQTHHTTSTRLPIRYALSLFFLAYLLLPCRSKAQDITGLEIIKTITHVNEHISTIDTYFKNGHELIAYGNSSYNDVGDTLVIYDFQHNKVLAEIGGSRYNFIAKFIHEDQLVYSNNDTLFRVVNFESPIITKLKEGLVTTVAVSPDLSTIAFLGTAGNDWRLSVAFYNVLSGAMTNIQEYIIKDPLSFQYTVLSFSADGNLLALNGGYENNYVYIFDLITGDVFKINTPNNQGTYSPSFYFQDQKWRVAVGGGYANGSIEIIDVDAASVEASIPVFDLYNYTNAIDPTYNYLACGGFDGILKLFKVQGTNLTELYSSFLGHTTKTIFTQDGQYVISGHGTNATAVLHIHRILREPSTIENIHIRKLHFYPNPTKDVLHIDKATFAQITIYDLQGRIILTTAGGDSPIDVSKLQNGVYLLKVENKDSTHIASFHKL